MDRQKCFYFIVLLFLLPLCLATKPSCPSPKSITLKKLKHRYVFISKTGVLSSNKSGHHSGAHSGNKWCPWTWATDLDNDRIPPTMAYAKCDNCNSACVPMYMYLDALKWAPQCDAKTNDPYLIWSTVKLPIAYVYNYI